MTGPRREVHQGDALEWLRAREVVEGASFFSSLPDVSELGGVPLESWRSWFIDAAALMMSRCPDDGVVILYQTDIRHERRWVDKGYLCQVAAERAGLATLWHRVVCRVPPGTATTGRPAWAHLLCFSRRFLPDLSRPMPDVLPDTGTMTWTRAMGLSAVRLAIDFIRTQPRSRVVVDPFCGVGTALAAANAAGLDAVGVELSRKRARRARALQLPPEEVPRHWPGVARTEPGPY